MCLIPESESVVSARGALLEVRARVADTRARLALLDEVVSRDEPPAPYAPGVHSARSHLDAALADLVLARLTVGACIKTEPYGDAI